MDEDQLPREVRELCRQMKVNAAEVTEFRVGVRQPRRMLNGWPFWVTPVMAVTRSGKKYSGEVVDLNDFSDELGCERRAKDGPTRKVKSGRGRTARRDRRRGRV